MAPSLSLLLRTMLERVCDGGTRGRPKVFENNDLMSIPSETTNRGRTGLSHPVDRVRYIGRAMGQIVSGRTYHVVLSLALAFQACGGNSQSVAPEPPEFSNDTSIRVEVENRNFSDATVYAMDSGFRQRLGRVGGKSNETFTFRWERQQLAMYIDFTGGGRIVSEQLTVHPETGDDLRLVIAASTSTRPTLRPRT